LRDLNDRTEDLLTAFRKAGYCTDCWVNLYEESHEPHCENQGLSVERELTE
jgi:hypothetical protein